MFSLVGVVLIARPQFLFGDPSHSTISGPEYARDDMSMGDSPIRTGGPTPAQRLGAVGYGFHVLVFGFAFTSGFFDIMQDRHDRSAGRNRSL